MHTQTLGYREPDAAIWDAGGAVWARSGGGGRDLAGVAGGARAADRRANRGSGSDAAGDGGEGLWDRDVLCHAVLPCAAGSDDSDLRRPGMHAHGAGSLLGKLPTMPDQSWTITRTSCLGLCDLAPAALVRESPVGPLTADQLAAWTGAWCGEIADYRQPRRGEIWALLPDRGRWKRTLSRLLCRPPPLAGLGAR